MTQNNNLANCAIKVFEIYQMLFENNVSKKNLLNDFSEDTLLLYINSLKKIGVEIKSPNKAQNYYQLKNRLNLINIENDDLKILNKIKLIISKKFKYIDLIHFNNFLLELTKYVDNDIKIKLTKIIEKKPISIHQHQLIEKIENYIKRNISVEINYGISDEVSKKYNILPQHVQLKNANLYLWGKDNQLNDIRCFKFEKILFIQESSLIINGNNIENYIIFELPIKKFYLIENDNEIKILEKNKTNLKAQFYFKNNFELFQKILNYGLDCKIIEPLEINNMFKEKILRIKNIYEK